MKKRNQIKLIITILFISSFLFGQKIEDKKSIKYYNPYKDEVQSTDCWTTKVVENLTTEKDTIITEQKAYDKNENIIMSKKMKLNNKSNLGSIYNEFYHLDGYKSLTIFKMNSESLLPQMEEKCIDKDKKIIFQDKGCIVLREPDDTFNKPDFRNWISTRLSDISKESESTRLLVKFIITPNDEIFVKSIGNKEIKEDCKITKLEKDLIKVIESIPKNFIPKNFNKLVNKDVDTIFQLPIIINNSFD